MTDPVRQSRDFDRRLAGLGDGPLRLFGPRLRSPMLRLLVIVVALVVGVAVGVTLYARHVASVATAAAVKANHAEAAAAAGRAAARALCEAGNDYRAGETKLWNEVLGLTEAPKTAQQADIRRRFVAFIANLEALRDCSHLQSDGHPVGSPPSTTTTTTAVRMVIMDENGRTRVVYTTTTTTAGRPGTTTTTTQRPAPTPSSTTTTSCTRVPTDGCVPPLPANQ